MNKITKILSVAPIAMLGIAAIGITAQALPQYLDAYTFLAGKFFELDNYNYLESVM